LLQLARPLVGHQRIEAVVGGKKGLRSGGIIELFIENMSVDSGGVLSSWRMKFLKGHRVSSGTFIEQGICDLPILETFNKGLARMSLS
jgi:hypothetical protein